MDSRDERPLLTGLRILAVGVVVAALAVVSSTVGDSDESTVSPFPAGQDSRSGASKRCGAKEAERVARLWFRGLSSGQPERIRTVTSAGDGFLGYVISSGEAGQIRTSRFPSRASAAKGIPKLIQPAQSPGRMKTGRVVNPPKAMDTRGRIRGVLAGVEFDARLGETRWEGKVGLRCENDTAYFAAFAVSGP